MTIIGVRQASPLDKRQIKQIARDRIDNYQDACETIAVHERRRGHMILVATISNEVVGFMCYIRQEYSFVIRLIVVKYEHERKGVGTALLNKLIRRLNPGTTLTEGPDRNLHRIITVADPRNRQFHRLLTGCGFTPTVSIPRPFGMYSNPCDYMVYSKKRNKR